MKKTIVTIAIVLGLSMTTFADPNHGGLFQRGAENTEYNGGMRDGNPMLPGHGLTGNQDANETPLGSGIAVLMGLGAAYALGKKRKED